MTLDRSNPKPPETTANRPDFEAAIHESILEIAPDLSLEDLTPTTDLQRDLGLDSIDLVNIALAIAERTGITIPEADYARCRRVGDVVDYVASAHAGTPTASPTP